MWWAKVEFKARSAGPGPPSAPLTPSKVPRRSQQHPSLPQGIAQADFPAGSSSTPWKALVVQIPPNRHLDKQKPVASFSASTAPGHSFPV